MELLLFVGGTRRQYGDVPAQVRIAEAAVPRLLGLLEDDDRRAAAATAPAGVKVAGKEGHDLLPAVGLTGGADAELAARAYRRIGGEPGPATAE